VKNVCNFKLIKINKIQKKKKISEKTKNHQGGLGDKADESDPKMFSTGISNCPVEYLKSF